MSALLVGYARCSTDQQDLTAQRDGLLGLGVEAERIYVDHGLTVPLNLLCGQPPKSDFKWPCPVIPLAVNVVQYRPPTSHRCYMLGKAIKRAVESYPDDLKVVIFGTGGLSHQISGPRAGLINPEFDNDFLDKLIDRTQDLRAITRLEYLRESGSEGIELIMWLIMRAALGYGVEELHRFYRVPASNTAVGHVVYEARS